MGKETDFPASQTRSHTTTHSNMEPTNSQSASVITKATVLTALVQRLENVAVSALRPGYTIWPFDGDLTEAKGWLEKFERYARLQNMNRRQ